MRAGDVLRDAGRPVAYHADLARALGSIPAALMLTQLLYWTDKTTDGWVWKLESDWDQELAFTSGVVKGARSVLVDLGLIEHKRDGLPAKPFYRVDMDALDRWWERTFGRTSPVKIAGQDGGKSPDIPYTPETTAETTKISEVAQVFEAWKASTKRTAATVLDAKRTRLITAALKTHPLADVLDAVRGWEHSAHHRGENDGGTVYNDLGLLLRDAANVERFRDLARGPRQPGRKSPTSHLPPSDRVMAEDPNYWEEP